MKHARPELLGLAALAALVVHGCLWGWSYADFSRSIDFNAGPLEDFMGPYLGTARAVAAGRAPAPGFLYGPFFAVLLQPFARLSPAAASWTWLALELLSTGALVGLALRIVRPSPVVAASYVFVALLAFPLVHNLHWGQVGVPLAALVLAACHLHLRGRPVLAAWALALATAIKFHPALFLMPLLLAGERRAVAHFVVACALFLLAAPAAAFGLDTTLEIYRSSGSAVAAATRVWEDAPNAQYFGFVTARWMGATPRDSRVLYAAAGVLWAGLNLMLAARRLRLGRPGAHLDAYALVAVGLPLMVYPSWPHYLALLPFAQLVVLARRARDPLAWGAVAISAVIAGAPFFRWIGDPAAYGRSGWLLAAHLVLLPSLYRPSRYGPAR